MSLVGARRLVNILQGARDIVANRWVKGDYVQGPDGDSKSNFDTPFGIPDEDDDSWGYCGDGALRRAAKRAIKNWKDIERRSQGETLLHDAQKALSKPVHRRLRQLNGVDIPERSHQKIWCFNDLPETTLEDMLACYDEAIEDACKTVRELSQKEDKDERQADND